MLTHDYEDMCHVFTRCFDGTVLVETETETREQQRPSEAKGSRKLTTTQTIAQRMGEHVV